MIFNKLSQISIDDIMTNFASKKIIIFGAGADGICLYKEIFHKLDISYFVDNGDIDGLTFAGKRLHNFHFLQNNYLNEVIIVASLTYYHEIGNQLIKSGFLFKNNFWIWDGNVSDCIINFADDNIKAFIEFNKSVWNSGKRNRSTKNKILLPYRNTPEIIYPAWSYAANYLADKYDANIYCAGGIRDILREDVYEIYKSFNVTGFIDESSDDTLNHEMNEIFNHVWNNLHTKDDIKNITVYGEKFGTDILRDYLRLSFPQVFMNDYLLKKQIKQMTGYIVFWHKYFLENHEEIKAVIVWDGIYYREGIMRKIAYGYGIPVYTFDNRECFKWNYDMKFSYEFYKKFFYMLTKQEQKDGMRWAKEKLEDHMKGAVDGLDMGRRPIFGEKISEDRVLEDNDRVKVMICPHYSEDDAFPYGDDMLFHDPWEWLEYLGEMSNKLPYDWYLKPHPIEKKMGDKLISDFLIKYPQIKLLPRFVSPIQLKNEGMKYALTIHGSIGYEYPYIGIHVINAGYNPHISFGFDLNPKNVSEYSHLLNNLEELNPLIDKDEICQFYCIHFGYYKSKGIDLRQLLYKDERLCDIRGLIDSKTKYTTELFKIYTDEMSERKHQDLLKAFEQMFVDMDEYKDGKLYKKSLL